jgi:hypothetical protein
MPAVRGSAATVTHVAGPLRLLDGDFPEREPMLAIVDRNVRATVSFA